LFFNFSDKISGNYISMNKLYVLLIILVIVIIFGVFYNYSQKKTGKELFSSGLTSINLKDFKTTYPVNFNTEKWTTIPGRKYKRVSVAVDRQENQYVWAITPNNDVFYAKLLKDMNPKNIEFKLVTNSKYKYVSNTVDTDGRQYIYAVSKTDNLWYQEVEPDEEPSSYFRFSTGLLVSLDIDINREGKKVFVGKNVNKDPYYRNNTFDIKGVWSQLKGRKYLNVSASLNDNNKYVVYGIGLAGHVFHNNMRGRDLWIDRELKSKNISTDGATDVRVELDNRENQFVYWLNVNGQLYNYTQDEYKWQERANGGRLDPSEDFPKILHFDIGLNKDNYEFHHLWIVDSSYTLKYKKMVFSEEPLPEEEFLEEQVTTQPPTTTAAPKIFEDLFTASGKTETECLKLCMKDTEVHGGDFNKCYGACLNCKDEDKCRWLQEVKKSIKIRTCTFNANIDNNIDNDESQCVSQCRENGELCSENVCVDICNRCTDFDTCKWLKQKIANKKAMREISHPSQPQVEATPFNKTIKISWTIEEDGGDAISKILLLVIKNNDPNIGMRLEKIFHSPKAGGYQDYLIKNLENGEEYTIVLGAVNIRGVGPLSNPIVMKPFQYIEAVVEEDPMDNRNQVIELQRNKLIDRVKKSIQSQDFSSIKNDIEKINQIQEALFSESEKESNNYLDYLSSKELKVTIS